MQVKKLTTDVLVIGAGAAGLRAAIESAKLGVKVLVISKEKMGEAHSSFAQGGLNVAIKAPATPEQHYQDTINGGWKINNYKMAKIFSDEMPDRIYDLESYGVKFDRLPDGSFYTWAGGKQSAPLNLCAGDYTGREMMNGLVAEIRRLKIPYLDNTFVTKLFQKGNRVIGAFVLDQESEKACSIETKETIVATGGAGMMYLINSNESTNTGEGYAWGLDVGCKLVDIEMVQFHPTGTAYPESRKGRLISEKVRGHLGLLKNKLGERFMAKYQPERMELAGRDEVARAIYQEIAEGRGTEHGGVYLDVTHWEKGKAEKIIPDILETFLKEGIDIRKQMMEICPTMHHMMGGININEWGETGVKSMYAVGEVTRNIHGANRLGGNSLAEGQVFGRRTGIRSAETSRMDHLEKIPQKMLQAEENRLNKILERKSGKKPEDIALQLKNIMWTNAGLIRNEQKLKDALKMIKKLQKASESVNANNSTELRTALEVQEMLKTAEAVVIAALVRKESRGSHYREDYPTMDQNWEKNIQVYRDKNGELKTKIVPLIK